MAVAFFDYVDAEGNDLIAPWLQNDIPVKIRARFDQWISYLAATQSGQWTRPHWAKLDGNCEGLYELRARDQRVQYRIVATFGPGRAEVTLLFGAIKREARDWVPSNTCDRAYERWAQVQGNPAKYRRQYGTR